MMHRGPDSHRGQQRFEPRSHEGHEEQAFSFFHHRGHRGHREESESWTDKRGNDAGIQEHQELNQTSEQKKLNAQTQLNSLRLLFSL
jgi:hypothetical protein